MTTLLFSFKEELKNKFSNFKNRVRKWCLFILYTAYTREVTVMGVMGCSPSSICCSYWVFFTRNSGIPFHKNTLIQLTNLLLPSYFTTVTSWLSTIYDFKRVKQLRHFGYSSFRLIYSSLIRNRIMTSALYVYFSWMATSEAIEFFMTMSISETESTISVRVIFARITLHLNYKHGLFSTLVTRSMLHVYAINRIHISMRVTRRLM